MQHTTSSTMHAQPIVWAFRMLAVLAAAGLLAVCAPLIWSAVHAGVGLLSLAVVTAIGFAAFQALPIGLQKLENRLLAWRKAEARSNPIEQLQNECLRREDRLQSFRQALVTIGGQIESMRQMIDERRHTDPMHVLHRQERAVQRMAQFYEANVRRLEDANAALEAFKNQVKQKVFEWEFAQAGQVVMQALNPTEMDDLMQGLLTDEALRSVQQRFNTVFAELDVEMRSMDAATGQQLPHIAQSPMADLEFSTLMKTRSTR